MPSELLNHSSNLRRQAAHMTALAVGLDIHSHSEIVGREVEVIVAVGRSRHAEELDGEEVVSEQVQDCRSLAVASS